MSNTDLNALRAEIARLHAENAELAAKPLPNKAAVVTPPSFRRDLTEEDRQRILATNRYLHGNRAPLTDGEREVMALQVSIVNARADGGQIACERRKGSNGGWVRSVKTITVPG
jgi:hypothetical protein